MQTSHAEQRVRLSFVIQHWMLVCAGLPGGSELCKRPGVRDLQGGRGGEDLPEGTASRSVPCLHSEAYQKQHTHTVMHVNRTSPTITHLSKGLHTYTFISANTALTVSPIAITLLLQRRDNSRIQGMVGVVSFIFHEHLQHFLIAVSCCRLIMSGKG